MSLVEKELTKKNIELAQNNPEFNKRHEREVKLLVAEPHYLGEIFEADAAPIEQIYLSDPEDEFSLRIRKTLKGDNELYTATLKDRGEVVDGARDRLEIDTPISKEAYEWLANIPRFARVTKRRAEPIPGLTIDFMSESGIQVVEVEADSPEHRARLIGAVESLTMGQFIDVTGDTDYDNESLAHALSGARISGVEKERSRETLDEFTDRIVREMVAHYSTGKRQVVAGLTGMSGAGKTTVTRGIQERITELFGNSYTPIVVSTDDYHFGKKHLEERYGAPWTVWDDPRTYNTAELARDLELVAEGNSLIRRHFDFKTEEVVLDEEVKPAPFVVIEGLYAGSKDLASVRDLHFELPTGIATSIGRDVRRLLIENRANRVFPTPESRLNYQIETALPLYLSQERPERNRFNASMRTLAERAFMLDRLAELAHE